MVPALAQDDCLGKQACGERSWPFALLFAERGKGTQGSESVVQRTKTSTNTTTSQDGTEEADTDWEEGT
jgi:hypothetical protein